LHDSRFGERGEIRDNIKCRGGEAPEGEHHACSGEQSNKKKIEGLNSGYHGVMRLRVIETGTVNIHNQGKRVLKAL